MRAFVSAELISAVKILFGAANEYNDFVVPERALIKAAFRKKVKLFHPDLAVQSSMSEERLRSIFLKISSAYDMLINYWNEEGKGNTIAYNSQFYGRYNQYEVKPNIPVPTTGYMTQDYYYRGELPLRKLRFGEFLFYTGRINWRTFMDALVYQCQTRQMLGSVCVDAGFIDDNDVQNIMANRRILESEKFGDAAIRLGYLSKQEISYALRKQYAFGQPFGKYFLDKNIFSKRLLQQLLSEFHNRNFQLSLMAS